MYGDGNIVNDCTVLQFQPESLSNCPYSVVVSIWACHTRLNGEFSNLLLPNWYQPKLVLSGAEDRHRTSVTGA